MGVATAILATAILAGAGVSAWAGHQQQVNQQKRQAGLLKDAERKEADIKKQAEEAQAKSEEQARKKVLASQQNKTQTILTGAAGEDDETVKKEKLGA